MNQSPPLLRDKLAWDGKKLIVTDEAVISQIRRKALSASTSKSMQSCAARWVGERLLRNEVEDPFAPAPLGTSAHSVLEDFYDDRVYAPEQRTMNLAERIVLRDADEMWPDLDDESDAVRAAMRITRRRWIEEVKIAYEGIFVIEDPKTIEIYDRELQIDGLTINGVPTNGFIDRVRYGVNKAGKRGLWADDYKSGKIGNTRFGDDHGDQLRIYAAALKEKTGEMPVGAGVLYTKFGKDRDVDISQRAIDKTLKVFELSWKRHNNYMKSHEFPTKVSALCGWCPLINSCPVAKAEGKAVSPKVADQMHSATHLGIPTLRHGAAAPAPAAVPDTVAEAPATAVPAEVPAVPVLHLPDPQSWGIGAEDLARLERDAEFAAHMFGNGDTPTTDHEKDHQMSRITEDKPWVRRTVEGELNPMSYAAMGLFGLTELAVEAIHAAGIDVTATSVKALSATLHHVVSEAETHWTGSSDVDSGANSRMRGALRTALATLPMPFGGDAAAWDAWVAAAIRRCRAITAVTLYLDQEDFPENPWQELAGLTPGAKAASAPVTAPVAAPAPAAEAPVESAPATPAAEPEAPADKPAVRTRIRPAAKAAPAEPETFTDPADDLMFPADDFVDNDTYV